MRRLNILSLCLSTTLICHGLQAETVIISPEYSANSEANSLNDKLERCANGCHNPNHASVKDAKAIANKAGCPESDSPVPHLAGQHAPYLIRELENLQTERRVNPTMNCIAKKLDPDASKVIAKWWSTQTLASNNKDCGSGLEICDRYAGEIEKIVWECGECHDSEQRTQHKSDKPESSEYDTEGAGQCRTPNDGAAYCYPRLAGQKFSYLYEQLKDFRAGTRISDAMNPMAKRIKAYADDREEVDMLACIARHYCSLK